jgi:DNA primase
LKEWLATTLSEFELTDPVEEYLLGRGAKEASYHEMGIKTWGRPRVPAPDKAFRKRYGALGERIKGCLVCPFYTPTGDILGFEARRTNKKWLTDYRIFPRGKWLPVWLGTRRAMSKIRTGVDVWVVEGLFDLFALEWVVPEEDIILASVRAQMSFNQVQFIERLVEGFVHIVYDEDETGRKGASQAVQSLQRVDIPCRQVRYVGGKDPGEIWDTLGETGLKKAFRR